MKRRSISNEIRLSQSFSRLSLRQRDLWHGLIATADDQGRLPGVPAAVRSLVWPYDDVLSADVQSDLNTLGDIGNILIYSYGDAQYIQIVNWWQYQQMQWAGASKYPAPEGWKDRERYHSKGRKIVTKNWDTPGGFFIETEEVKVNDNVKVNARRKTYNTKVDNKGSQFPFSDIEPEEDNSTYRNLKNTFYVEAKLPLDDNFRPRDNEVILLWVSAEVIPEDIKNAVQYATDNELTIVSPASIHKGVMIARSNRLRTPKKKTTLEMLAEGGYK